MLLVRYFIFLYAVFMLTTPNTHLALLMVSSLLCFGWLFKNVEKKDWKRLYKVFKVPVTAILAIVSFNTISAIKDQTLTVYDDPARMLLIIPVIFVIYELVVRSRLSVSSIRKQYFIGAGLGAILTFAVVCYQYFILKMNRPEGFTFVLIFSHICLVLGFQAIAGFFESGQFKKYGALGFISVLLSLASCFMTGTRGAWVYIPLLVLGLFFFYPVSKKYKSLLSGAIVLLCMVGVGATYKYSSRIDKVKKEVSKYNFQDSNYRKVGSLTQRFEMIRFSMIAIKKAPWLGSSKAERIKWFKEAFDSKKIFYYEWGRKGKRRNPGADVHSTAFNFLTRQGVIFGLLSYLLLLGLPLYVMVKSEKRYLKYLGFSIFLPFFVGGLSYDVFNQHDSFEHYAFFVFMLFLLFRLDSLEPELDKN